MSQTEKAAAISAETEALMLERKAIEAIDPAELLSEAAHENPALPNEYLPLMYVPNAEKERLLLAKARKDRRLTAREKVKMGLLFTISRLKGSDMRVAGESDVKKHTTNKDTLKKVSAKEVAATCDAVREVGCIMQRYTANIKFATAQEFAGLEAALSCTELSKITDLNDQWYRAAITHGDESYWAQEAKKRLANYIVNLRVV